MDSVEILKKVKGSYDAELIKLKKINDKQLITLNNLKGFYDKKLKSELELVRRRVIKQNNDKLKKLQLKEQQRTRKIVEEVVKSESKLLNKLIKLIALVSL